MIKEIPVGSRQENIRQIDEELVMNLEMLKLSVNEKLRLAKSGSILAQSAVRQIQSTFQMLFKTRIYKWRIK